MKKNIVALFIIVSVVSFNAHSVHYSNRFADGYFWGILTWCGGLGICGAVEAPAYWEEDERGGAFYSGYTAGVATPATLIGCIYACRQQGQLLIAQLRKVAEKRQDGQVAQLLKDFPLKQVGHSDGLDELSAAIYLEH